MHTSITEQRNEHGNIINEELGSNLEFKAISDFEPISPRRDDDAADYQPKPHGLNSSHTSSGHHQCD